MKKTLLIIRQELIITFKRPSYLLFAFGIPVLAVLIFAGIYYLRGRPGNAGASSGGMPGGYDLKVEGYVDHSGIVQDVPDNLPAGRLVAYDTEALATEALQAGIITAYYVVPQDYLAHGEVFYVYPEDKSLISDGQEWVMQWTLLVNLLGGDEEAADQIWNPIWHLETISPSTQPNSASGNDCSRPGFACESNAMVRYLPLLMVVLFYISFMASSTMLFNSIGSEKENRTIEVILLSVAPRQMFGGKTIAYGCASLLQTIAWLAAIAVLLIIGGQALNLPKSFIFPVHILIWSLLFFLGGFAVYASLMAGAGALVPKLKEAGAVNFIVMGPLLAGYIVGYLGFMSERINEILPIVLSLFPLTAPILMVMRLTNGLVPLWQLLLSAGWLFVTAYFVLRAVAAMFQAQNLLSGQSFSMRRYVNALITGR